MAARVPNICVTMERMCHPIIVRTIKWNNDLVNLDSRVAPRVGAPDEHG